MGLMSTMNCPDCGAGKEPYVPCTWHRCPSTAQARWDAALEAERQMIADLDADDGTGHLGSRVGTVDYAFRLLDANGVSKLPKRDRQGLTAAHRSWQERQRAVARRALQERDAASAARLAEIRTRFKATKLLTLDDVRFLLTLAEVTYDMCADEFADGIDGLLA